MVSTQAFKLDKEGPLAFTKMKSKPRRSQHVFEDVIQITVVLDSVLEVKMEFLVPKPVLTLWEKSLEFSAPVALK